MVTKIQLKWGAVQGDWLEEDLPYNWAIDSEYREAVTDLIESLTEFCKKKMDWDIVRDCVQRLTESVADYRLRLSKMFRNHSGLTLPDDPTVDSPHEQQE